MILEIEVCFPGGRFHGEEWPPEPARLFQALVAAAHLGAHRLQHAVARDAALRWLENLPPPTIVADAAVQGGAHLDNYVPNNDDAPHSHVRAAKTLTAHSFPAGGIVTYRWTLDGEAGHADVIAAMASLVTHLGRTTDGVFARGQVSSLETVAQMETTSDERRCHSPREVPGGRWRAPASGFFDLLVRRYPRSVSSEVPDFTNSRQVDYALEQPGVVDSAVPVVLFDLVRSDSETPLRFSPLDVRRPAGLIRGALLDWVRARPYVERTFGADTVARLVAGHESANNSARSGHNGHFGIVPLPSLNQAATADGELRRAAFIGWGITTSGERELFEEAVRGLHGAPLHDRGRFCGMLVRTPAGTAAHWRAFWGSPAQRWRSVTPVVLPGLLRRGRLPENLVTRALNQAGYDLVQSVAAFTGPIVPKSYPARAYRLSKDDYLNTTPRRHVEILFDAPVSGPLVLGRGRYVGLGLCLPVSGRPCHQPDVSQQAAAGE